MKQNKSLYIAVIAALFLFVVVSSFNSKQPRYWIAVADFQSKETRWMVTITIRAKDYEMAKKIFDKRNQLDKRVSGITPIKDTYYINEFIFEDALTEQIFKNKQIKNAK